MSQYSANLCGNSESGEDFAKLGGRACKPDFVRGTTLQWCRVTIIPLAPASRPGSSDLPEGSSPRMIYITRLGAHSLSPTHSASRASSPLLFGLAPREVCHAPDVATGAVGSYPTFSPLPTTEPFEMSRRFSFGLSPGTFRRRYILCGTVRDVAETAAFAAIPTAPPGVTRRDAHTAFAVSVSGLSSRSACAEPAIIRLTRHLNYTLECGALVPLSQRSQHYPNSRSTSIQPWRVLPSHSQARGCNRKAAASRRTPNDFNARPASNPNQLLKFLLA